MHRYLCIHGHFYQPPRENPWSGAAERQESAHPYHDWNQRIAAECYAPNAAAPILDEDGRPARRVSNYERISFNFGPTLLGWMERGDPETYRAVLEADRSSRRRFSGHGSAIAQVCHHPILPLAGARDKRTEVLWGRRDFEHRFGRRAEGMWLPETAVDLESLEVLADCGIRFTLLAPGQASRYRLDGETDWRDAADGGFDTSLPYRVALPSGRTIDIFFYDGPVSHAVAFERLLDDGESFVDRLLGAFPEDGEPPRLVHIATDGETYGHHHRHGEMALAYALDRIESSGTARITNYGEYLERHPPTRQVEIAEETSWSCAHGVGRWREDCGCRGGRHPDWRQTWRAPLREALERLRDRLAERYERAAAACLEDPWAARDDYVEVILDGSAESIDAFVARHARGALDREQRSRTLRLLEMQRQSLRMFTSCGWFFDEISGIETVQILRYAGRALQLAEELFDESWEGEFLEWLERAPSNRPEYGNGRVVYERRVRPARIASGKT